VETAASRKESILLHSSHHGDGVNAVQKYGQSSLIHLRKG